MRASTFSTLPSCAFAWLSALVTFWALAWSFQRSGSAAWRSSSSICARSASGSTTSWMFANVVRSAWMSADRSSSIMTFPPYRQRP